MELIQFLSQTFLFKDVCEEKIEEIVSHCPPTIIKHSRTETINHFGDNNRRVGFIVSGKCEVIRKKGDETHTVLNVLGPTDSFGILSILSEEDYSTEIYVTNNSTVLYFSKEQTEHIVNNYSHISMNLIKFLANRITFLNKKIETFSGTRVENRLASYLLSKRNINNSNIFPLNLKKCSEAINAGRASVYRALDSLSNCGLITFVDKKINIIDPEGLERIIK